MGLALERLFSNEGAWKLLLRRRLALSEFPCHRCGVVGVVVVRVVLGRINYVSFVNEASRLTALGARLGHKDNFMMVCNEQHIKGAALVGRFVGSGHTFCFLTAARGRTRDVGQFTKILSQAAGGPVLNGIAFAS